MCNLQCVLISYIYSSFCQVHHCLRCWIDPLHCKNMNVQFTQGMFKSKTEHMQPYGAVSSLSAIEAKFMSDCSVGDNFEIDI